MRCLVARGARVTVVPWDAALDTNLHDAFFISNGPGDPQVATCPPTWRQVCATTVANIRGLLTSPSPKPVFGICLGHQVAAGEA